MRGPAAGMHALGLKQGARLQVTNGSVAMCLANQSSAICNSGYACAPLPSDALQSLGSNYTSARPPACAQPWRLPS